LIARGLPAVVISTERFNGLALAMMRAQRVPASTAIEIKCNPEFVGDDELAGIADALIEEAVARLSRSALA
jgi:hypothetical protein